MHAKPLATALIAALTTTATAQKNTTAKPKPLHYGVLLLPSVTPIDVFGPVDVFTALAMTFTNQTGKLEFSVLSVNSTPATTNPPLKGLDFGFPLLPTITFDQYRQLKAHNFTADEHDKHYNKTVIKNKGPLDVLIVPGGGGARAEISKEIAFVKEIYPDLKYIISVCTGSTVLARAGVLDGKRATTNKKAWAWATSFGKNVKYQPKARWVSDGNVWTGSGVSAATDTAYAFVADIYGEDVAQYVADVSEYTRWTNASLDPFAERWGVA